MANYSIKVNGEIHEVSVHPDTPLIWVLRDNLGLVGTKYGCGVTECGTCTVHVDGIAMRSCTYPISNLGSQTVTTIEGLSKNADHPLQEAWREYDVPQCGYCQSGQIMSAAALLSENKKPTDREIDQAMRGNICRCGTYLRVKKAIKHASKSI
ncbi:MAG: (2Fe-2S)-binding protein [Bacteroidia bacterium]|nr:(2Fe-2S)-binding protein [Bacteroidia bacterium]NNK89500.1 (2Fe-2S)-binding protein [Saprospiraceae bacterium]